MTITRGEFNNQCIDFAFNRAFYDQWILKAEDGPRYSQVTAPMLDEFNLIEWDTECLLEKNQVRFNKKTNKLTNWEYNVIYNESYEVPVLYFNVSNLDGTKINVLETETFSNRFAKKGSHGPAITQTEHPLYFRPYYVIHPCRTRDFMKLLIKDRNDERFSNYLTTWLSTVASVIGLDIFLTKT